MTNTPIAESLSLSESAPIILSQEQPGRIRKYLAGIVSGALLVGGVLNPAHSEAADNFSVGSESSVAETFALNVMAPKKAKNAILVLADDMGDIPCNEVQRYLPKSSRWLKGAGVCYENATTPAPVCCPARAAVQSGRLPHNNGVVGQESARRLDYRKTVQHTLSRKGVQTFGIAKHLNGINAAEFYGKNPRQSGYKNAKFIQGYAQEPGTFNLYNKNGSTYKPNPRLNSAQVTGQLALNYMHKRANDGKPFYISANFIAPHEQSGNVSTQRPTASKANARDKVPAYNRHYEADASDKLPMLQHEPTARDLKNMSRMHVARLRALRDIDDQMARFFTKLKRQHLLDDTIMIFTSDNGYHLDRWRGKSLPYPASTDIPMLVHYPDGEQGVENKPVSLIDIAPTIMSELGKRPNYKVDGRPLRGNNERKGQYFELQRDASRKAIAEGGRQSALVPSWRQYREGNNSMVIYYHQDGSVMRHEFYRDAKMEDNLLVNRGANRPAAPELRYFIDKIAQGKRCQGTSGPQACF